MKEQNELFGSFVVRLVVAHHATVDCNQGERVRPMKRVVIYRAWCRYAEVQEVYASWKANNERWPIWLTRASCPTKPCTDLGCPLAGALGRAILPGTERIMGKKADQDVRITREHDGCIRIIVRGFDALVFNPARASLLNRDYAQFFGWANRFMNKAAVSADPNTGRVNLASKHTAIAELVDFYEAGGDEWTMGGKPVVKGPDAGMLVRAMVRLGKARDVDHANEVIAGFERSKGKTREEIVGILWKDARVVEAVKSLRAEDRLASMNADADALLDEIPGDEEGPDGESGENAG